MTAAEDTRRHSGDSLRVLLLDSLASSSQALVGRVLLVLLPLMSNPSLNPTTGSRVAKRTAEERLTGFYYQKGGAGWHRVLQTVTHFPSSRLFRPRQRCLFSQKLA